MDPLATIQKEWPVISQAPWSVGTIAILCLGAGWVVAWFLIRERGANLESRLKLRDEEIADYKNKLSGATPDEAKARLDALESAVLALSPRRLSEQQNAAIKSALGATRGVIELQLEMSVADVRRYGADFERVFREAGWQVLTSQLLGLGAGQPPSGLALKVGSIQSLTPLEQAVLTALRGASVRFHIQDGYTPTSSALSGGPTPNVVLLISAKID